MNNGNAAKLAAGFAKIGSVIRRESWRDAGDAGPTPARAQVLAAIGTSASGRWVVGDVARQLAVTQPTASDAIKPLEHNGLVSRQRSDSDAPVIHVAPTSAGRRRPQASSLTTPRTWTHRRVTPIRRPDRAEHEPVELEPKPWSVSVNDRAIWTTQAVKKEIRNMRTAYVHSSLAVAALLLSGCASTPSQHDRYGPTTSWSADRQATIGPATNRGFRAMSEAEFETLKKSVLFTEDDVRYLRMSRSVLEPHVDELLDVWYGFVGSNEHLVHYFSHPTTGQPDGDYLAKVRVRFRQWVLDTADANFDQAWLNRQLEYGLRHHRLGKNKTDGVDAVDHVHFRHLVALHYPITTTLKPFLSRGGHSQQDIDGMYEAWRKAVLLTVILWSQPYVEPRDF